MKNLDKIAKKITKTGAQNMIIHTIPKTPNWIIAEKIKRNKWLLTLCNPNKYITYNLGTIDDKNHIQLWQELVRLEIETKISQIKMAKKRKNY